MKILLTANARPIGDGRPICPSEGRSRKRQMTNARPRLKQCDAHWCIIAFALLSGLVVARNSCAAEKAAQPIPIAPLNRTASVDFESEILPIFRASCLACHNRTTTKSGLILETPQTILKGGEDGPVIVPGKSADSQLLVLAAHQDKPIMPPRDNKASASNLTGEQLALVKLWIDQGAKGEVRSKAIAWQPVAKSFTPAYAVAVTNDAQFAAAGRANRLDVYQLPFQRLLSPLADPGLSKNGPIAHRDMIYSLAFSPDGNLLASGSFGEVKLWRKVAPEVRFSVAGIGAAATLPGAVCASPDGKWFAIAGDKHDVRLIDAADGKVVKTFTGHGGAVRLNRFSADSARLLSATEKSLRVWTIADGSSSVELTTPAEIRSIAWTHVSKQVAVGFADHLIRLYKLSDAAPITLAAGSELKGHTGAVTALDAIATPANQLLSGSADGTLRVWNLENGQMVRQMPQGGPITPIAVRADGKLFASAGENGITKIWDAAKGTLLAEAKGDRALLTAAADKETAQKLAAADTAYFKSVLQKAQADLKAQEERVKKAGEAKALADKPVSEKEAALTKATDTKAQADKALAAATVEQKKLVDTQMAAEQAQKDAETAVANAKTAPPAELDALKAALAAKTKSAADAKAAAVKSQATLKTATDAIPAATKAVAAADDALKVAQRVQANAINEVTLASAAVTRVTEMIANQQSTIAVAEERQKAAEADAAAAKEIAAAADKPIRTVAFSTDGLILATAGDDQKIRLWAAETGATLQTFDAPKSPVLNLAFNSAGLLICGSADGSTTLWDISPRWILDRTIGSGDANSILSDRVNAMAFSPDGRTLATGSGEPSRGGEIKLWNVASGNVLRDFKDIHSDAVLCLDFSHDGKRLASGAADRFVKIIDLASGKMILALEGHTHHVLAVSFKADGRTLASTGADGQVKMWDLVAGERKAAIPGSTNEVTSIHFIGITDQAVLSSAEGQMRVVNETGGNVRTFAGPVDHIHAGAIAGDGKTLISGGQSGAVYQWDAAAGKLMATFAPAKAD
jgi:WD40 repeat protein